MGGVIRGATRVNTVRADRAKNDEESDSFSLIRDLNRISQNKKHDISVLGLFSLIRSWDRIKRNNPIRKYYLFNPH